MYIVYMYENLAYNIYAIVISILDLKTGARFLRVYENCHIHVE